MRQKRLTTLIHPWLVHRLKAGAVYYVAPTEDNIFLTEKKEAQGLFAGLNKDVGEIIVTGVTAARIAEFLAPDRTALQKLIRKQN